MKYCDICKERNISIQIRGIGKFCSSCYNDMMAEVFDVNIDIEDGVEVTIDDCDHLEHIFKINYVIMPIGVRWRAEEINGYIIELNSSLDTELKVGLWQFIEQIQLTLSYKSLTKINDVYSLKNIGFAVIESEESKCVLRIDDKIIAFGDLERMFSAYNGKIFEFQFRDAYEKRLGQDMILKATSVKPDMVWNRFRRNVFYYQNNRDIDIHIVLELFEENFEDLKFMIQYGFRQEGKELGDRMKHQFDDFHDIALSAALKDRVNNIIWLIE